MKLSEALHRYINESGAPKTRSSVITFTMHVRTLGLRNPTLELDQFKTAHLVAYCTAGNPAPNTVRTRKTILRSFFEWCTYMRFIETNPALDLKYAVRPGSGNVRMGVWLAEHEVAGLLASCGTELHGRRDRALLVPGFFMGLRVHEIANLRWAMFSTDLSRLTFVGKGRKLVQLGVPPQARVELQAWRREAPVGCQTLYPTFRGTRWSDDQVIHWETPIGVDGCRDRIQAAGKRFGLTTFDPHDMRRTYAGVLEAKGVPLADISRMLRHSDMGTTSRYLEKNPNKTAELADAFELAL